MSATTLPELTLAVRFGWLSEWLRKRDAVMVELELDYMYPGHGRIIGPGASGLVAVYVRKKFG